MVPIAAANSDLFSVIFAGKVPAPSLRALLGLPAQGALHLSDPTEPSQRNLWATRLDAAVLRAERPVLLVASGASCFAAAWWARLSPSDYSARIAGALLVDPDESETMDAEALFASPRVQLPFPSIVVSGRRARQAAAERVQTLASNWGSGVAQLPAARRTRRTSLTWQVAHDAVNRAASAIIERRMRVAGALGATN